MHILIYILVVFSVDFHLLGVLEVLGSLYFATIVNVVESLVRLIMGFDLLELFLAKYHVHLPFLSNVWSLG